ncbi:hypothetical protein JR316_0002128 [Psilocybe cubensis]|uniref:Uncharacterized protein n=2 Tax=Psilocybe cubensis TaxID=181762 RepID=A0ACB8HBJ2_PSICU|nr:hypothetical protein JR316_0002128 [Psilocybe cubensis]KAH9485221.1 hypothetical protein JR316_0002128 [Psilocybe cubensis]
MPASMQLVKIWTIILLGIGYQTAAQSPPPSNLPPATPGVFTAQASIIIDAPIETAWEVLLDFPSYPEWNPFVRSQVVTNTLFIPLADQTPHESLRLIIQAQIPPLPLPVDADTPPNLLHSQTSYENITTIDASSHRAAWRQIMIPGAVLNAERWQALSPVAGGGTYYEAREVFSGPVGYVVETLFAEGLQAGFEAQAVAFKARVEGLIY